VVQAVSDVGDNPVDVDYGECTPLPPGPHRASLRGGKDWCRAAATGPDG
jgi:hypothetical protein